MGRIGRWFKKAWKKVKKVAKKVGRFIADKGLKVGRFVTGVAQHIPGKIGMVAGLANKGIAAAQAAIDAIPKGKVKDKLQQGLDKANEVKSRAEAAGDKVIGVANKVAGATNAVIDTGKNVVANVKKVI